MNNKLTSYRKIKSRKFIQGFTLIELVFTMVIVAILSGIVAVFVKGPITTFFENTKRADFSDTSETFYKYFEKDLSNALPNSFRYYVDPTNGAYYLEFVTVREAGLFRTQLNQSAIGYVATDEKDGSKDHLIVNNDPPGTSSNITESVFEILGRRITFKPNDQIVLCNFGKGNVGTNIYDGDNLATIDYTKMFGSSIAGKGLKDFPENSTDKITNRVVLKTPTAGTTTNQFYCPLAGLNRFWIVDGPVLYVLKKADRYPDKSYKPFTGGIWRYSNYGYFKGSLPPTLNSTITLEASNPLLKSTTVVTQLASEVRDGSLRYFPTAIPNADLITARIYVRKAKYNSVHSSENIVFYKEAYVGKAP